MPVTSFARSQIGHVKFFVLCGNVFEIEVPSCRIFPTDFSPTASAFTHWISHGGKKNMCVVENVFWQSSFFFLYKFHRQISGNLSDTPRLAFRGNKMHRRKNTFFVYCFCSLFIHAIKKKLGSTTSLRARRCGINFSVISVPWIIFRNKLAVSFYLFLKDRGEGDRTIDMGYLQDLRIRKRIVCPRIITFSILWRKQRGYRGYSGENEFS